MYKKNKALTYVTNLLIEHGLVGQRHNLHTLLEHCFHRKYFPRHIFHHLLHIFTSWEELLESAQMASTQMNMRGRTFTPKTPETPLYNCHWLKRNMENAKFEVGFFWCPSGAYVRSIWRMNLPLVTGFQLLLSKKFQCWPTLLKAINCTASFPGFWSKSSWDMLGEPKPLTGVHGRVWGNSESTNTWK